MPGALDRFLGFQTHHVEKASEGVEPVTAHQRGQLGRQSGDIGSRLHAIAQGDLRNRKVTDSAGLGSGHSAIPDESFPALLSRVAIARAMTLLCISATLQGSALIGCNRREIDPMAISMTIYPADPHSFDRGGLITHVPADSRRPRGARPAITIGIC